MQGNLFKMKTKKSQLRIQEMAFMLVAVILFFVLVGLFAFSIFYYNLQKSARQIGEQRTLTSITNLADSPEFSCGKSKVNCVDFDKAMALMGNKNYENFWPFSSLEIVKLSAFNKNEKDMKKCNLENYPDCERLVIYDKKSLEESTIASFIALCRNEFENNNYQRCEIAKLVAGTDLTKFKKTG